MKRVLKVIIILLILSIFILVFYAVKPKVEQLNKEDYADATVDEQLRFINQNMVEGGPPKDGIPSIDQPKYVAHGQEEFLEDDDLVFGVNYKGEVKAYPKKILYWHEIVNDNFVGDQVSITYCPLTGSVIGYKGKNLGVSGNLYNSNLVMYDRKTDTEIPQILGMGVNGPLKGVALERFPIYVTTWKKWREKFPQTEVLSSDTGFTRNYDRNPYPGYDDTLRVWFPLVAKDDQFHSKKIVTGFAYNGKHVAIPKEELKELGKTTMKVAGENILLSFDDTLDVVHIQSSTGDQIIGIDMYWFAWYAYHPDTEVLEI